MTFKLSPGVYVFNKELDTSSNTYSGNPVVMVGSFKKGSLTPTRIVKGINDSLYDLSNSNFNYGYSTAIANIASEGNALIIKRVVSNTARTSQVSLMRSKNVKDWTTLKVDSDGNTLQPYAIFFDSPLTEDYKITVSFSISGNYGNISTTVKYKSSHNDTVKELVDNLKNILAETGLGFILDYNQLSNSIQAIYIYPPFGFSLYNGKVEVLLDLLPLTLEQKAVVLDRAINNNLIAQEDRPALMVLLDNQVFYKDIEVLAFLQDWAKNNYLSAKQVEDRISYYTANKIIDSNAIIPFYNWLGGKQHTTKTFQALDYLCSQFKDEYYLSESQIRQIIEDNVDVIITEADVDTVITDIFSSNNWLYTSEQQVTQTLVIWAEKNLVSTNAKKQWINQYIYQSKIRQADFDEALTYVSIPIDNVLTLQHKLDEYCSITYMTTAEKEAVIETYVESGELTKTEADEVLSLVLYLIRRDESYLIGEYIKIYLENKKLSVNAITDWVNTKISSGWLLAEDKKDFLEYLKNDALLVYNYNNEEELQSKLDDYTAVNYLTKPQAETYLNTFVNVSITQEDATYILDELTTNVVKQATLDSEVLKMANKYFTKDEIKTYVAISNINSEDVDEVLSLFDNLLILKTDSDRVSQIIEEWKADNYMNEADVKAIADLYNQSQSTNTVYIRNTDFSIFYDSIHNTNYKKNDSVAITFALQQWSQTYYLSQDAILVIWNAQVDAGTAYGDINVWKSSSYYSIGGLYKTTNEVIHDITEWSKSQINLIITEMLSTFSGYDKDIRMSLQLNIFVGYDETNPTSPWEYKEKPSVVESYNTEGPVFKDFQTLQEATTVLNSFDTAYQDYSTIVATMQSTVDYDKLSGEQKDEFENMILYGSSTVPSPNNYIRCAYYISKEGDENELVTRCNEVIKTFYRTVTIQTDPSDAIVTIDNVKTTSATGIYKYPFHYKVEKEGYIAQEGNDEFDNKTITVTLTPES